MTTQALNYTQQPDADRESLRHIPGNWGWPLLGAAPAMFTDQLGFARRRYERYGELSRMQLARRNGVLALGPELAQQILLDPQRNFSSKMAYQWWLAPYFGEHYLLGNDFEEHKFQRSIMQTGFRAEAMRGYVEQMNPELAAGIAAWQLGKHFRFYDSIKELLLELALKVFYGVEHGSELAPRLSQAYTDVTTGQRGLFHVDRPGFKYHVGQKARRLLRDYLKELLPRHRQQDGTDMLSYMAKERKPDGTPFSDEELIDHATFLLFAAHDTNTSTLTHMVYYMARYPQWQQRLRDEGAAFERSGLDYEQLDAVPLLEAVFHECQRLHPAAQVLQRRTIRPCELGGYRLPANTIVYQFPAFSCRWERYWDRPDSFEPERFLPPREEHRRHPFCFMPFGGGAHKCIGMHFGAIQAKMFCHLLLQNYRVQLRPGYREQFVTLPLPKLKDGLPLVIEKL